MKNALKRFDKEVERLERKFDIFTIDVSGFCDKVIAKKRIGNEEKISGMLKLDATLYMYLGLSSTKKEREETKKKSRIIYRAIKTIDKALGDSLLSHQDKP